MRFRSTVFCLAVILSCVTHGSDTAYGQSPTLPEAFNHYIAHYQQGQYSESSSVLPPGRHCGWEVERCVCSL